ncbi:hypothetical protein GCG54_00012963 [Colletotrichum gloeosporioides]|uniref:Uncharacterized protein n=1 Tax=Colletotrichum gloeosporioides TaxID=474922 RepID=A0A8H4FQP6_COLGL|nr:uncharacterized protein GCG54_00012963 [Colletotrichum gloeosporioides]KAF3809674.1 hypothetical protein GCG54_00012963 [Colletotrichum gloeosporioides]
MEATAALCMQTAEPAMSSARLPSTGSQTWATTSIATREAPPTVSRPRVQIHARPLRCKFSILTLLTVSMFVSLGS